MCSSFVPMSNFSRYDVGQAMRNVIALLVSYSFLLSVMMYSCLHGQAPQYLLDFCQPVSDVASRRHLRSAGRRLLNVPHQRRSTFARRAFSVTGPLVWNSLPDYLRDPAVSRDTFCKHLKTFFVCSVLIYVQRIKGFTTMRYINLRFTYLLTYLLSL